MYSRRGAIRVGGRLLAIFAAAEWPWSALSAGAPFGSLWLAHSAAALALACKPPEIQMETRPLFLAHAAMALDAVGDRRAAAGALVTGWRLALASRSWGVSLMAAKLAWAAAYLGDASLSDWLLSRAYKLSGPGTAVVEIRMVGRYAARIRCNDFAYRIDAKRALGAKPACLLEHVEARLAAGDLVGAVALALTRSEQWDAGENATAQALLARVIARPRELAIA